MATLQNAPQFGKHAFRGSKSLHTEFGHACATNLARDKEAPRFLIRDNDGIYGHEVTRCLANMGVEEVKTAPHSPWQNAFVERLVGTLRRECLDHVIVLNEQHLQRILREFIDDYYHPSRCHMALDDNSPLPRKVEPPDKGEIVATPVLGGLHYTYRRAG